MKQQESHPQSNPSTSGWTALLCYEQEPKQSLTQVCFLYLMLIDIAYICVCFIKCTLEQEGREFHVPIIYPLFQINAFEMFSWHIFGCPSKLAQAPGFAVYLQHTQQKCCTPHLNQSCGSTFTGVTAQPYIQGPALRLCPRDSCSFPWATEMPGKGSSGHISVGVLVMTGLCWGSVSSVPRGNFQPCLFSSLYLKPLFCIY